MNAQEAREFFEEVFAQATVGPEFAQGVRLHSEKLADAVKIVAEQLVKNGVKTVEPEEAYCVALLHDIGKTRKESAGLNHSVVAYRMLKERGWDTAARIAMTHTYYGYREIDRSGFWERFGGGDGELRFTLEYMEKVEFEDLDLLIQLLDCMVDIYGAMSIEDRFCDIVVRHKLQNCDQHLRVLFRLKMYFDELCGMNIYELFRNEIIKNILESPSPKLKKVLRRKDEI